MKLLMFVFAFVSLNASAYCERPIYIKGDSREAIDRKYFEYRRCADAEEAMREARFNQLQNMQMQQEQIDLQQKQLKLMEQMRLEQQMQPLRRAW